MLREEEEETGGGGKERNTRSRGKGGDGITLPTSRWASRRENTACENNRFQTFVYK